MSLINHAVRWPTMVAIWAVWGIGIGLVVAVTAPAIFGLRPMTVLTGSMRPGIQPGDMVVDQPIHPTQIRVGDIVTFQDPEGKRTITHRVRKVEISEGQARVVTRGDANDTVERWVIPVTGHVGRVVYQVPKIGYPVTWSHTRDGRLAMVSLPALLLTIMALIKIWRSDDRGETDPEEGELAHAEA
jgi:signal peptidase I